MKEEEKAKLHSEALKRFDIAHSSEEEQRELCLQDHYFINEPDGQWAGFDGKMQDKPKMTLDYIEPLINQVTGDQQQSKIDVKILPGDGANKQYAEYLEGVIRGIEAKSNAADVYSREFANGVTCGIGGWRVYSKYVEGSFDQELAVKPIHSAVNSLWFDPSAQFYTKEDARWAFVNEIMLESSFKEKYPKASLTSFDNNTSSLWYKRSSELESEIRVAEYWRKVKKERNLVLFNDGITLVKGDDDKEIDSRLALGLRIIKQRKEEYDCVKMVVISGSEVLTDEYEWPTPLFPLIPYYCKYVNVNGKSYYRGMVRKSRDPQVILNFQVSAMVEASINAPADKIVMHSSQVNKGSIDNFNNANEPVFIYEGEDNRFGAPFRSGPPALQQQALAQIQTSINSIHSITGIEPASAGRAPHANESGRALLAQQSMGDRGTYGMHDNLKSSVNHCALILKQAIPKFYDTRRMVEIIGADDEPSSVNVQDYDQFAKGKYSVVCSSGSSHTTKRRETVDQLITIMTGVDLPENMKLAMVDLLVSNLDINKGDVLTERVKRILISQGIIEPTEEEAQEMGLDQQQQPSPMDEAFIENMGAETRLKAAKAAHTEAKTMAEIQRTNQISVDSVAKLTSEYKSIIENGGVITKDMLLVLAGQIELLKESQITTANASRN